MININTNKKLGLCYFALHECRDFDALAVGKKNPYTVRSTIFAHSCFKLVRLASCLLFRYMVSCNPGNNISLSYAKLKVFVATTRNALKLGNLTHAGPSMVYTNSHYINFSFDAEFINCSLQGVSRLAAFLRK